MVFMRIWCICNVAWPMTMKAFVIFGTEKALFGTMGGDKKVGGNTKKGRNMALFGRCHKKHGIGLKINKRKSTDRNRNS